MHLCPTLVANPIIHGHCVLLYSYNGGMPWYSLQHNNWTTQPPWTWRGWRFPHWLQKPDSHLSMIHVWFGMKPYPTLVATPIRHGPCAPQHAYNSEIPCHSLNYHPWINLLPWTGRRLPYLHWKLGWHLLSMINVWFGMKNGTTLVSLLLSDMINAPSNTPAMMIYHVTEWIINLGLLYHPVYGSDSDIGSGNLSGSWAWLVYGWGWKHAPYKPRKIYNLTLADFQSQFTKKHHTYSYVGFVPGYDVINFHV